MEEASISTEFRAVVKVVLFALGQTSAPIKLRSTAALLISKMLTSAGGK
jgi:hypothetical protein